MKKISTCFVFLLIVICPLFSQENSNWRGPDRNGAYPDKNLLKEWPENGPELLWRFDELGVGYSTVATTAHNIFAVGSIDSTSYIYSFDLSGNLIWKSNIGPEFTGSYPGIRSTPVIYNELGYVRNGFGKLFCFNTKSGDIEWSKDTQTDFNGRYSRWGVSESLVVDGDKVFCSPGGIEANVVALNRLTGELIWKSKGSGDVNIYSSSILIERGGVKFLIAVSPNSIMALNANTGEMAWKYQLATKQETNTPIYKDGILFLLGNKTGTALKIADNGMSSEFLWENNNLGTFQGDAALLGNYLYTYSANKKTLYGVDWYTGNTVCEYKLAAKNQMSSVIAADKMIYLYSNLGSVELFDPAHAKLELISSLQISTPPNNHSSYPIIAHGNLYIRNLNSLLVYNLKAE